jgi:hypothetical protein
MSRRHVNNQAFYLTPSHSLKRRSHLSVMCPVNKIRPDVINERHKVGFGFCRDLKRVTLCQKLPDFCSDVGRKLIFNRFELI